MEQNPPGAAQQQQRQQPVYDPNVGGHYGMSHPYKSYAPLLWKQIPAFLLALFQL